MPTCVSETSYYLIFVAAIIITIALIIFSIYAYDKFKNFQEAHSDNQGNIDENKLHTSKNLSILAFVIGLLGVMTLFILFFGFQTRLVGVYTSSESAQPAYTPQPPRTTSELKTLGTENTGMYTPQSRSFGSTGSQYATPPSSLNMDRGFSNV